MRWTGSTTSGGTPPHRCPPSMRSNGRTTSGGTPPHRCPPSSPVRPLPKIPPPARPSRWSSACPVTLTTPSISSTTGSFHSMPQATSTDVIDASLPHTSTCLVERDVPASRHASDPGGGGQKGSMAPSPTPSFSPRHHAQWEGRPPPSSTAVLTPLSSGGGTTPSARISMPRAGLLAPSPSSSGASTPTPGAAPTAMSLPAPSPFHPTHSAKEWKGPCRALVLRYAKWWFNNDPNSYPGRSLDTVVHTIQLWYRHHSIRRYLARQTRRRLAATTLQCWKRRIWLDRWFAAQAQLRQKRLRIRMLCRGASAHAVSVRGHCTGPTPTDKPFDPKVARHPFRDRGSPQPLPQRHKRNRLRRRRCRRCRRRGSGQRVLTLAPDAVGEGSLCMPAAPWATQNAVAAPFNCVL
jgi:hypothetical protein